MRLLEMFSPIGAPQEPDQDIDWLGDLKFYIDNNNDMLNKNMFPAVRKHKAHAGHPDAYKIYIRPIESCLESYCEEFQIESPQDKFPKEQLIELARRIAQEQEQYIKRGDYK
jgi:hypothetical protein